MNNSPESFAPGSQAYSDAEAKLSRAFERTSRFLNDGKIDQDTFDRKREDALQNYNNEIERLKQVHADSLAAEKQAKADLFSIFRDVAEQKAAEEATVSDPTDSAPRQAVDEHGVLTEDYLKSEQGQDALNEESRLYQRAEEIDRAVSDGKIDLETAKQLKDNLLEDSVERIDSIRERYEKLGTVSMQAAQTSPTVEPGLSSTNTNPNRDTQTISQVNPNDQVITDTQTNIAVEDDKLNRMIGKLNQQLSDGKAEGLTSDVIKNLRANMDIRLENNMRKQPQQANDQAHQTDINRATQSAANQAGNQSPITLSPELTQAMNDRAQEFAEWRNKGIISDSQYDNFIESNKAEFYVRQKSADAAAQAAAERARQDAKDKADQQAKNKADQDAKDRAAQQVFYHDANNAGDQSQDQGKDRTSRIERFKEEFKNLSGAQKFMTVVSAAMMPIILAGTVFGGIINAVTSNQPSGNTGTGTPAAAASANSDSTTFEDINPDDTAQAKSAAMAAKYDAAHSGGETAEAAKITYDYSEWSDFEHKLGQFNYGYDCSDDHGNVEAMKANMHKKADQAPQILSDYAFELLSLTELHNLGIVQMSSTSLSDYISNSDDPGSVETYQKVKEAVHNAIDDSDFTFKTKTGPSFSTFMYGSDENGDGELTPNEMHLGYSQVNRVNAKQVGVHRTVGMEEIDATFNEDCGLQSDHDVALENMTYLSEDEVTRIIPDSHQTTTNIEDGTPSDDTPPGTSDKDKPNDDKPGKPSTPDKPNDDKPDKDKPSDDKPTGDEPDDDEPSGDEPSDDEPSGDEPSDDTPDKPDEPDRGKGDNTHAGDNQEQMGETENDEGDPQREATEDNNASNANPGDQVTNNTIEEEHGAPEAAPGSEAIADNQGVTVDGEPLTDSTSGEQVVREGEGGPATEQEIADAAEGVASTFDPVETNADHSDAVKADNANTVQQPTVTDTGVGAGQNVDRSQADLANIVNGGGQ